LVIAGVCVASLGVALVVGCSGGGDTIGGVTDAGQETSIVDRAPPVAPETGPIDATKPLPTGPAIEGTYAALCTTKLALNDPAQAVRFFGETSFVPYDPSVLPDASDPDAGDAGDAGDADPDATTPAPAPVGGVLTMKLTPLKGWDSNAGDSFIPPSVSAQYFRTYVVSTAAPALVDGDGGRFTAGFGTLSLEAEANSISGRDLVIEQLTIDGLFVPSAARFCGRLGGKLTVPYEYDFVPQDNICMFVKVALGDPMPDLDQNEFVCAF
jgi:hypothetical protein